MRFSVDDIFFARTICHCYWRNAVKQTLLNTTSSTNVLFGLGHNYTAAQYQLATDAALHWIPADQGLEIGGTPVGSYAFMTNFVNKTVDGILRELDQLQAFVEGPNGTMRASTQTIYTILLC